jgi:predicted alpha/beta superfamily hydrolase
MKEIKRFQIRGVAGDVKRVDFDGRIVDYWLPKEPATHLLIAHDGQNVFDGRTSTHRGQTWKMAQSANRVSKELGIVPPAIIGVWHSSTKENPWGRGKDLVPEKYFRDGISVAKDVSVPSDHPDFLHGDTYLRSIFEEYVPAIAPAISPSRTAMIGSSMGGLATLYAVAQLPDKFTTALALSTHWPFGGNELVERTIKELPSPSTHKIWMSHGTKGLDSAYAPFQHLADKLMAERGYLPHNFVSKVYERSGHNERSWAKYLDQPMRFWLNT